MDGWVSDFVAGLKKATLLAGAAGTLLGIVVRRQFSWFEALCAAGSGIGCVLFVAPALVRWSGFADERSIENLAAFLCGLLGMYLVDAVFAFARDPFAVGDKLLDLWERFRLGRRPGGTP